MKRIVSVWFPHLAVNRLVREQRQKKKAGLSPLDDALLEGRAPFALVAKDTRGLRIFALNEAAGRGGVAKDMKLTDARALLPSLSTQPAQPSKDARALRRLGDWCRRYTPVTAVDGEDGLWLDVTGAAHLLGGEANLLEDLTRRLAALGFQNRLGLAATPGAAWALARFSSHIHAEEGEALGGRLAPLPVEALRLTGESAALLKRFGLKRIGQLLDLPRASLERRFSSREVAAAVLKRLDQALGVRAEPLSPLSPAPLYYERAAFAEPLLASEGFYGALDRLLEALCDTLEKAHKGARRLTFSAYRTDGGVSHVTIHTARASRDAGHFAHLFKDKVETINPGFGVDVLILSADVAEALYDRQSALGGGQSGEAHALDALIDRVSNRLGARAVTRIAPFASHLPERAEQCVPPLSAPCWSAAPQPAAPRPLHLFDVPEPVEAVAEVPDAPPRMFRWRRVLRRIVKASGPERIAPEWWRDLKGRARTRDYYTVEDEEGRRYWLFREGLYEGKPGGGAAPVWRIHGVFG